MRMKKNSSYNEEFIYKNIESFMRFGDISKIGFLLIEPSGNIVRTNKEAKFLLKLKKNNDNVFPVDSCWYTLLGNKIDKEFHPVYKSFKDLIPINETIFYSPGSEQRDTKISFYCRPLIVGPRKTMGLVVLLDEKSVKNRFHLVGYKIFLNGLIALKKTSSDVLKHLFSLTLLNIIVLFTRDPHSGDICSMTTIQEGQIKSTDDKMLRCLKELVKTINDKEALVVNSLSEVEDEKVWSCFSENNINSFMVLQLNSFENINGVFFAANRTEGFFSERNVEFFKQQEKLLKWTVFLDLLRGENDGKPQDATSSGISKTPGRAHEQFYALWMQALINVPGLIILTINRFGKVLMANIGCTEYMGYSMKGLTSDVLYLHLSQFGAERVFSLKKEKIERVCNTYELFFDHLHSVSSDWYFETRSGRKIPVTLNIVNIPAGGDGNDYQLMLVGIFRLNKSKEDRLRQIQMAAFYRFSYPLIITDKNRKTIWLNKAYEKKYGYSIKEVLHNETWNNIKSDYGNVTLDQIIFKALDKGEIWKGEVLHETKNGNLIPEYMTITPIIDRQNKVNGFVSIYIDMTEEKKKEAIIKKNKEVWRFVLEGIGAAIWDYDIQTDKLFVSDHYRKMHGMMDLPVSFSASEWSRKVHPNDINQLMQQFKSKIRCTNNYFEYSYRMLDENNKYIWVTDKGKFIYDEKHGQPVRVFGLHYDITSQKEYEESLNVALAKEKELSELKSRFVSMASHEFRTPLATILMAADILYEYNEIIPRESLKAKILKIKENVEFLKKIIEQVLDLSKVDANKVDFNPQNGDFTVLVDSIVKDFLEIPVFKNRVRWEKPKQAVYINMDQALIKQAITNLVDNALKYSPPESEVKVNLKIDENVALFSVQDFGIGIPDKDKQYIFDPFHRASNVKGIRGTGMGMSLTKRYIERHDAMIWFQSEENVGTKFFVKFPLGVNP